MGVYRKIRFLSIEAEISALDDFLALFMNTQIILSQKMEKKNFRRKQLATLSQRSPVKFQFLKNMYHQTQFDQTSINFEIITR